jgi:hypothetical protein
VLDFACKSNCGNAARKQDPALLPSRPSALPQQYLHIPADGFDQATRLEATQARFPAESRREAGPLPSGYRIACRNS